MVLLHVMSSALGSAWRLHCNVRPESCPGAHCNGAASRYRVRHHLNQRNHLWQTATRCEADRCVCAPERRCRSVVAAASSGSGGSGSGGSGSSSKGSGSSRAGSAGATAVAEQPCVTGPLVQTTLEQLTSVERQPAPRWDTFCGVSGGCWSGTCSAFSPFTGEPEAVALDDSRKPVFDLHTIVVDERLDDEGVVRRVQSAVSAADLQLRGNATTSQDEAEWDSEAIGAEEDGLVVFDGGSYSRGPVHLGVVSPLEAQAGDSSPDAVSGGNSSGAILHTGAGASAAGGNGSGLSEEGGLGAAADADGLEQRQVAVIEQCVAWGGESRVRFQITLACSGVEEGEELDLEILRVAIFREAWQCLTDDEACTVSDAGLRLAGDPRLDPAGLAGAYNVFDLSAVPVQETDPFTGQTRQALLYFSQETAQRWGAPPEEGADDGAALWLPGRLLLQLRMLPPVSRGQAADASEGMTGGLPRGLLLSAGWAAGHDGLLSLVEREYDGTGALTEVRMRTAVLESRMPPRM